MIATSARNGLVQRCKGGLFAALIGLGAHAADRVIAGTSLQRRAFGPEVRHFGRTTKGGLFAALIGLGAHAADRVIAGASLQRRAFGPEVRHFGRTTKGGLFAALIGPVNRVAKDGLCRQSGAQSIRAAP